MRTSFIELNARERARSLLDEGTFEEFLGPFDRMKSPWLQPQGVVPQSDDGVVIAQGTMRGARAVVISVEGMFQGGSIGEVSGAKIACALDLAREDCERGLRTCAILLLETGGVRLQEANLGLAVIAEIQSSIISLRKHVPVIGVIAGMVGCFGGMGISAGLCSYLIATRAARLGLNGPEVIEQEAGIEEFDSADRQMIWNVTGGKQRYETGLIDDLVEDDVQAIRCAISRIQQSGPNPTYRSAEVAKYLGLLTVDKFHPAPEAKAIANSSGVDQSPLDRGRSSRGRIWFEALAKVASRGRCGSVLAGNADLGGDAACFLAVVPDPGNRFPRARAGELGLEEGWNLAYHIREVIAQDRFQERRRPIIAIVDVPSQAYGRQEELLGIFLACAASVNAYADARLAGHPVISLVVGHAVSGGFLAHGYQANRILALDDPGVVIHAMGKQAAARVTRRSVAELDALAAKILPLSYDVRAFAQLGILYELFQVMSPEAPSAADIVKVQESLLRAIADARQGPKDLSSRLENPIAIKARKATIEVRRMLAVQWRRY
jgi:malonate decarboxylase beta subunit